MDIIPTTASSHSSMQPRDHSAPRRAFLDTYAKQRGGTSLEVELPKEATQPTPAQVAPAASQPTVEALQPRSQTIAVSQTETLAAPSLSQASVDTLNEELVPEMQPPIVGNDTLYVPADAVQSVATTQEFDSTEKSYLDRLTERHAAAVASAPEAEETVMQPELGTETQDLLDESDFMPDEKIEANLGALYGDYSLTNQLTKSTKSASASHVRTIVASSLACGVLALGIFGVLGRYSSQPVVAQPTDSPVIEVDAANVKAPAGGTTASAGDIPQADPSYPVRMLISSIGVNAPVQSLGTTAAGLIDVPQSYGIVGWYNKSTVPGKSGPAVLVGHYTGGNGGVFDKLKDLNNEDLITVSNGKGQTFTYKVSAKNEYDKDSVPMAELFKSSDDSKLQIITCSGKWQSKNYNKRLVITAEIVK